MVRVQNISTPIEIETKLWDLGYKRVCGIDEVGRGCLAGPVVVAGVVFDSGHKLIPGIRDSKKLNPKQREELSEQIFLSAIDVQVALVPETIIDEINILEATKVAMLGVIYQFDLVDYVLVDGRDLPQAEMSCPAEAIIKGDSKSYSIAAASIVAKVVRDKIICDLDLDFPAYGFKSNKGYGTKVHRLALLKHGPTVHHRRSFLRKILESNTL